IEPRREQPAIGDDSRTHFATDIAIMSGSRGCKSGFQPTLQRQRTYIRLIWIRSAGQRFTRPLKRSIEALLRLKLTTDLKHDQFRSVLAHIRQCAPCFDELREIRRKAKANIHKVGHGGKDAVYSR